MASSNLLDLNVLAEMNKEMGIKTKTYKGP